MKRAQKILVVEDEGMVALDIEQRLSQLGFEVTGIADTAADALALTRTRRPDLALVDIRIRGALDGIDLARALATGFDVPVVFLTGNADEATLARALEAEPHGYVLKPFELRTLEATVRTALYRHDAEQRIKSMQRWLGDTLSSVPGAVIAVDDEQRVTFLNPAAEQVVKLSLGEAFLRPIGDVLPDARVTEAVRELAREDAGAGEVKRFSSEVGGQPFSVAIAQVSSELAPSGAVVLLTSP